jgi:hypothetical protein
VDNKIRLRHLWFEAEATSTRKVLAGVKHHTPMKATWKVEEDHMAQFVGVHCALYVSPYYVCCNHQLLGLYMCPLDSNFLLWFTL